MKKLILIICCISSFCNAEFEEIPLEKRKEIMQEGKKIHKDNYSMINIYYSYSCNEYLKYKETLKALGE
jgi:hypothetical protein